MHELSQFFKYDPTVKASEILTALSILLAILTFTVTIRKGIRDRQDVLADKIRGAAAKNLSRLERWCRLSLWIYQDVQPVFVEVSEQLGQDYDVYKARDLLWRSLSNLRIRSAERILEESIEDAYVELSSYFPGAYDLFVLTLNLLENVTAKGYGEFLSKSQESVLDFESRKEGYTPAMLGNVLRGVCNENRKHVEERLMLAQRPLKFFLLDLIKSTNRKILRMRRKPVSIQLMKRQLDDWQAEEKAPWHVT